MDVFMLGCAQRLCSSHTMSMLKVAAIAEGLDFVNTWNTYKPCIAPSKLPEMIIFVYISLH